MSMLPLSGRDIFSLIPEEVPDMPTLALWWIQHHLPSPEVSELPWEAGSLIVLFPFFFWVSLVILLVLLFLSLLFGFLMHFTMDIWSLSLQHAVGCTKPKGLEWGRPAYLSIISQFIPSAQSIPLHFTPSHCVEPRKGRHSDLISLAFSFSYSMAFQKQPAFLITLREEMTNLPLKFWLSHCRHIFPIGVPTQHSFLQPSLRSLVAHLLR